jgi:hypothetical protein
MQYLQANRKTNLSSLLTKWKTKNGMRVIYSAKLDNYEDFYFRLLPICYFRQFIYLDIFAQVVLGRL